MHPSREIVWYAIIIGVVRSVLMFLTGRAPYPNRAGTTIPSGISHALANVSGFYKPVHDEANVSSREEPHEISRVDATSKVARTNTVYTGSTSENYFQLETASNWVERTRSDSMHRSQTTLM